MEWSKASIQDLIARVKAEEGREISIDEAKELAEEIFFWVKLLALDKKTNMNDYMYDKENTEIQHNN